jgi:hypothetical protein
MSKSASLLAARILAELEDIELERNVSWCPI